MNFAKTLNGIASDFKKSCLNSILEITCLIGDAFFTNLFDKIFLKHFCDPLDGQIDALVYELYDLTPDEIKIIEGNK